MQTIFLFCICWLVMVKTVHSIHHLRQQGGQFNQGRVVWPNVPQSPDVDKEAKRRALNMIGVSDETQVEIQKGTVGAVDATINWVGTNAGSHYEVENDSKRAVWMRSFPDQRVMDAVGSGLTIAGFIDKGRIGTIADVATGIQVMHGNIERMRDGLKNQGFKKIQPGGKFKFVATVNLIQDCAVVFDPPEADSFFNVAKDIAESTAGYVRSLKDDAYAVRSLIDTGLKYYMDESARVPRGFTAWTGYYKGFPKKYTLSRNFHAAWTGSNELYQEEIDASVNDFKFSAKKIWEMLARFRIPFTRRLQWFKQIVSKGN